MTTYKHLLMACVLLAACGGNPFVEGNDPGTDPDPEPTDETVVVPAGLKNNIQSLAFTPDDPDTAGDESGLNITITGLDTTPVAATWARRPSLDTAGYTAFAVQEDALDRLFIGLGKANADNSVRAVLAGDGGQFNKVYSGTAYERSGEFTPPDATGSGPATGQVSYAGSYVGLLNGGGDGSELLTPPVGADPETLPAQAARVTGDAFINANFADNSVGGTIYNRVIVDSGFGLESIVLVPTTILANGTFEDNVERSLSDAADDTVIGRMGGVFGGTDASGVAGAVSLTTVYDSAHESIDNALERGIFVLNQCGLSGVPVDPGCSGTAP